MKKLFPRRLKLQVIFKGPLDGKPREVFNFKTMKEVNTKEAWYKSVYKPDAVEFIHTPGMIQIHNKPQELVGTNLMPGVPVEAMFEKFPQWIGDKDTVWGQGFENTWYVAREDFSEVYKLKTINK